MCLVIFLGSLLETSRSVIGQFFFPVLSNRHSPRSFCAVNSVAFSFRFQSDEFERKSFCVMAPMGLIVVLQFTSETFLLCKKVTSAIGALRRIGPLISQSTPVLVYNSLIQPHFDYCSHFWNGLSEQLSDKLQKLQNHAARANLKANYGTSSSLLLDILKWDKLVISRKKQKAIMMFKSLNEQAPVYLQNLFHERSTDYDLRNSFHKLTLPRPRT